MLGVNTADVVISIHAPRGGSDAAALNSHSVILLISIHAPRGGSDYRVTGKNLVNIKRFQSTLPVGGATLFLGLDASDLGLHFNPRSPWGERPLFFFYIF